MYCWKKETNQLQLYKYMYNVQLNSWKEYLQNYDILGRDD